MLPVDDLGQDLQAGDRVRKHLFTTALLCLVFLTLGACLLLAARGMLREEGVTTLRVSFEGGGGKLCLPETAQAQSVPLYEEEEHDDHDDSLAVGGSSPAALVLGSGLDGTHALATELARRGVAVLLPDRGTPAADAWAWLTKQGFADLSSVALIASKSHEDEALSLGTALAASGPAPAATILLGDEQTLRKAAGYPGRDLLVLTGREAEEEARRAFFGADYAEGTVFTGYFGDGTARAVSAAQGRAAFSSRKTLCQIIDWQGSALGHAVELPDDNEIFTTIDFCRIAAVFCLIAAAAIWPLRRGSKEQIRVTGTI